MLDTRTNVLYNIGEMITWNHLLAFLGFKPDPGPRYFELDENLHMALVDLAHDEQRPAQEVQADLLTAGLARRHTCTKHWQCWESLSPRERDVAALTCLGYTNRQMAARLKLAPDTIKGYVRQVLVKFQLHSKGELRLVLTGWDFSLWGPPAQ
jgi:DNA-binding CsgD family transcriptional regulator